MVAGQWHEEAGCVDEMFKASHVFCTGEGNQARTGLLDEGEDRWIFISMRRRCVRHEARSRTLWLDRY